MDGIPLSKKRKMQEEKGEEKSKGKARPMSTRTGLRGSAAADASAGEKGEVKAKAKPRGKPTKPRPLVLGKGAEEVSDVESSEAEGDDAMEED